MPKISTMTPEQLEKKREYDRQYVAAHREQCRAYTAAHAAEARERSKKWRAENPEKCKAQRKAHKARYRAKKKQERKQYLLDHPEILEAKAAEKEQRAAAYKARRKAAEKLRMKRPEVRARAKARHAYRMQNDAEYAARYRERTNAQVRRRRALHGTSPSQRARERARDRGDTVLAGSMSSAQWVAVKALFSNSCALCGKPETRDPAAEAKGNYTARLQRGHVFETWAGGAHNYALGNIMPLCSRCNLSMKTNTLPQWFELGRIDRNRYEWIVAKLKESEALR